MVCLIYFENLLYNIFSQSYNYEFEETIQIQHLEFDKILTQNSIHTVLFESYENGKAYVHTPDFLEICVESNCHLHSQVLPVKLLSHNGETFFAQIVDK